MEEINKQERIGEIKEPISEEISEKEVAKELHHEEKEVFVEKELPERKRMVEEELKEIEKIETPPVLREEVKKEAEKMGELDKEGKINRLLALAREKGLSYAVSIAKGTNDAHLLDTLHDALIKDELYKKIEK